MDIAVEKTEIEDVYFIRPEVFGDERGFFTEVYREDVWSRAGMPTSFVQFNHSGSEKNVVRGLHFQWEPPMGKLMRVTRGEAFLVAVDIRKGSPTLGKWVGRTMLADERELFWAPAGFARGFAATSDFAEIQYLTTGTYNNQCESGVFWNDPEIGIPWPVENPIVSKKDEEAQSLKQWLERPESDFFTFEGR